MKLASFTHICRKIKDALIYAVYLESFCVKDLATRKVFAFSDSAYGHDTFPPTPFRCSDGWKGWGDSSKYLVMMTSASTLDYKSQDPVCVNNNKSNRLKAWFEYLLVSLTADRDVASPASILAARSSPSLLWR